MSEALDNYLKYLKETDDEQILQELIALGIEEWEGELWIEEDYEYVIEIESCVSSESVSSDEYEIYSKYDNRLMGVAA